MKDRVEFIGKIMKISEYGIDVENGLGIFNIFCDKRLTESQTKIGHSVKVRQMIDVNFPHYPYYIIIS